jgi:hypothetical protein
MRRSHAALCLTFVWCWSAGAAADNGSAGLCQTVARDFWANVATAPLREQTPLAELPGLRDGTSDTGLAQAGQSIAEALVKDHAADPELAQKLHDMPPVTAMRFGKSDVWLLDRVEGSLGCHTPIIAAVPPNGPAHEIALPDSPDPTALCALSALSTVSINGTPALWIEQSGGFSSSLAQSTVSVTGLAEGGFAHPCGLTVDYVVSDTAAHAFCDGVDCVPLIRTAEILAMRLRQEETAESLGAGVIRNADEDLEYHRMGDLMAADRQADSLPTFGVTLDTPFLTFAGPVTFPIRLGDQKIYLARLGHGGFGWRQTADTLLALYRLRGEALTPVASVYVTARRTGIEGVSVQ